MIEIWKDLKGSREIYQVSNLGNVRTKDRIGARGYYVKSRELIKHENSAGYYRVSMRLENDKKSKSYFVHRLVGLLFLPREEGKNFINHIDGNKHNNSVENLEWCTRNENEQHAWRTGLKNSNMVSRKGEQHGMHKLSQLDVDWIRANHKKNDKEFGTKPLSMKFNVCPQTITEIVHNRSWNPISINSELITGANNKDLKANVGANNE